MLCTHKFMIKSINITHWFIQRILTNKRNSKKQWATYIKYPLVLKRLLRENNMPYLCWFCNGEIQQECVGINICADDM